MEKACNARDPSLIPGSGRSTGEGIGYPLQYSWASLVAQLVKNLPAMWETWVRSLVWEDSLEKGMTDYPLQYSGLENSMDRGAWWATVHGVAKSRTQLNNFHFHSVFNKTIFLMKVKDVEEVILIEHMNCTSTNCIY